MRSKILDAASELFVSEGIPNVSIRKIAERIEYSPATIYLYFRDKEHILSSLCEEIFNGLKYRLEEIEGSSRDPVTCLRAGLRCYVDFGLAHPHHYLMVFNTPHTHTEKPEDEPDIGCGNQFGLETFDCLRRALRRCQDAGAVQIEDMEATAQATWTFVHGLTSLIILYYSDPHFPWVEKERLIERSLDLIVGGIGVKTGRMKKTLGSIPGRLTVGQRPLEP